MANQSFINAQRQAFDDCMTTCEVDMKPRAHKTALTFSIVILVCFALWFFSNEIAFGFNFVLDGIINLFFAIISGVWSFIIALNLGAFFTGLLNVLLWPFGFAISLNEAISQLVPSLFTIDYGDNWLFNYLAFSISATVAIAWAGFYLVTALWIFILIISFIKKDIPDDGYLTAVKFCFTWLPLAVFAILILTAPTYWLTSDLTIAIFGDGFNSPFWSIITTAALFALPWFILECVINGNLEQTQHEARRLFADPDNKLKEYAVLDYLTADIYNEFRDWRSTIYRSIDSFAEESWWRYRRGGLLFLAMIAFLGFMFVVQAYAFIDGYELWIALIATIVFCIFAVPKFAGFITCYPEIRKQFAITDKDISKYNADLKPLLEKAELAQQADIARAQAEEQTAVSILTQRADAVKLMVSEVQKLMDVNSPAAKQANDLVPLFNLEEVLEETLSTLEEEQAKLA